MKRVLFATTNQNKVKRMKNFLGKTPFEILSLTELNQEILEPIEVGADGVEVAKLKAYYYYNVLKDKLPVLTQDDTLNFYQISESDSIKISIKQPVIDAYGEFNDDNAIKYYTELAKEYGGEVKMSFEYGHGFFDGISLKSNPSSLRGKMVSVPSKHVEPGYFLTAIVKVNVGNGWKYISELSDAEYAKADWNLKKSVESLLSSLY